ncbi:MAG: OpgC domain-containing protein [Pseudomonadota bacterium]
MNKAELTAPAAPPKRPRDLRLDFFRGIAMFIILLAHTPGNTWTLWIPARFGFSDATEIFVFCSGMASAMAFGTVFAKKSWFLGSARIAFRVWQVYWAHIGVFLATALLMVSIDQTGLGTEGRTYADWFPVNGFFNRTHETMIGLFTLTYIPGLFDILPMYLVILGMVPIIMALHRFGGRMAVFAFMIGAWTLANLAGYARIVAREEDIAMWQQMIIDLGEPFLWMNFRGLPWSETATWFFNPFGWQLVFFTGFSFAMGWIPAPPVNRRLVLAALFVVLATMPFAWNKVFAYETGYWPESWGGPFLWDAREFIEPVRWKTWVGGWRFLHFLSVAYLAWAAVGPGGIRLSTGWGVKARADSTRAAIRIVCAVLVLLTAPYAYVEEIAYLLPALDRWIVANWWLMPARWIGLAQILHLACLITLAWHSVGDRTRHWLLRDAFLSVVPIIRKVGTQSLAVFMVSIVLSRFNGWWLDVIGRDVWTRAMVNLTGFAVLILTAYVVSWFKRQPWRDQKRPTVSPEGAPAGAPAPSDLRVGAADPTKTIRA